MPSIKKANSENRIPETIYIALLSAIIILLLTNQFNLIADVAVLKKDFIIKKDCCEKTGARLTALEAQLETLAPPIEYKIDGYHISSYKISDVSRSGEELMRGEIYLLNGSYRWECARWNVIVQAGEVKPVDELVNALTDTLLKDAVAIVCVGTASSEDPNVNRQESLAAQRMDFLHDKLVSVIPNHIKIYGFNFGQYLRDTNQKVRCSGSTEEERRVFIVKITKLSTNNIGYLEEFLRRKFGEVASNPQSNFPVDIRDYSMHFKSESMLRIYSSSK